MSFEKPKILWLDPADFLGGAELFSLDVLPSLAKDFKITVMTNEHDSEFARKLPNTIEKELSKLPQLKPITPQKIIEFFRIAKNLHKYIGGTEKNFDLIHTNSIRSHIIASQALKKIPKNRRPKLTFFIHDFTFPKWAIQYFSKQSDMIFTCSEAVKKDICTKGVSEEKISVIPNGIDVEKFSQIIQNKELQLLVLEQPIIGLLGRIDWWKGQDIFLKAAQEVIQKYPKAQFKIYGESSPHDPKTQQFEKRLREFVERNNLSTHVQFCGFIPAEEVFSQIDILIHASTQSEPFGRVIIEALAAETPVIASNLGGSSEIIENNIHGFLIPPKNPELLATKIIELIENEDLRKKFSENGKKLVAEEFSLQSITKKLVTNWNSLLQNPRS